MFLSAHKRLKNAVPFSDEMTQVVEIYIDKYMQLPEGAWLREIWDKNKYTFKWFDLDIDDGLLGAAYATKNDIYIAKKANTDELLWLGTIFSVIIHELRHKYQIHKYGVILWSLLRLPELIPGLYGKGLIEKDAVEKELEAERLLGHSIAVYEFEYKNKGNK